MIQRLLTSNPLTKWGIRCVMLKGEPNENDQINQNKPHQNKPNQNSFNSLIQEIKTHKSTAEP